MSALRELQHDFLEGVLRDSEQIYAAIDGKGFSPEQRVQVYRNNAYLGLTKTLEGVFPVVLMLVGGSFFRYAAHHYIRAHMPVSANLNHYGDAFPEFLEAFPAAQSVPYLMDIAQLEWLRHEAYQAADAPDLDVGALMSVAPEQFAGLRFRFHPSVSMLSSAYPVYQIWEAHQQEPVAAFPSTAEHGESVLVWRKGDGVLVALLDRAEAAFVASLRAGAAFEAAYEAARSLDEGFDLQSCLQKQVQRGVFSGFSV